MSLTFRGADVKWADKSIAEIPSRLYGRLMDDNWPRRARQPDRSHGG
jgi:hypothetical protein